MGKTNDKTLKACMKQAEKGQPDAQFEMGLAYSTGAGVDQDLIAAHKWFNLAAMNGSEEARHNREDLARIMSALQVAQAQREAREWVSAQAA